MNSQDYDAIVIGSGAGGAAAAYRLVMGGLNVALLEKGHHLPTDGSTLDIQRVVHEGAFLSREPWTDGHGRGLAPEEHFNVGGKTKWYGAALLRFGQHEFLAEPAHQCAGWPLTLPDLEPYYTEAEKLLGVRLFEREPDLARILGKLALPGSEWQAQAIPLALAADITAHRTEAAHFDGFASVAQLKGEAEGSILSLLKDRHNFTLVVNTEVRALVGYPDSPKTISGVRLSDGRELRAPRVFLAGRNLKLHLLTAMVALSTRSMTDLIRKTVVITNKRFAHSSVQPLGFDSELIATLVPKAVPDFIRRQVGKRAYGFFLQTEDGSNMRNCVRQAANGGAPILDYDETRLPEATREHKSFTRSFQWALAKAGFVTFTRRIGLNGTAHVCGSLICGRNSTDSVVDANGRVHGMKGLYVVDGSVLPRSSRVNPSLTIYAWGLRVGDLVARAFRGSYSHA